MQARQFVLLTFVAALALTSLSGCGKKGPLDPPPPREITKEKPKSSGN